uniref:Uncharacterized protein n=1 Tax=Aegilops tauschii subsp. strangulata TaxID=200361 RepID=A0A452YAA4_AEGTS
MIMCRVFLLRLASPSWFVYHNSCHCKNGTVGTVVDIFLRCSLKAGGTIISHINHPFLVLL